jgi:lipid-A-disaccharide synthase
VAPDRTGRIFISAGDISGDIHAAGLIARCLEADGAFEWNGLGGERMAAAGCHLLVPPETDPVIGFRKVIGRVPYYAGLLARVHRHLKDTRPDLVVLVDYPGLNMQIARLAGMLGLRVLYFICPQYWAWAPWRLKRFAKLVDRALVIFPFEKEFFKVHGVDAVYIGHPACDRVPADAGSESDGAADAGSESDGDDVLTLLPGSRKHEIRTNLPVMLRAAASLTRKHPGLTPRIIHQLPECLALAEEIAANCGVSVRAENRDLVRAAAGSRFCLVASGTATLEVAVSGSPFAVVYRVSPTALRLSRRLLTVPWFCQVNLMAGEEIVPEFLLDSDDPGPLVDACATLWEDSPEREEMIRRLADFRSEHHRPGALDRAAVEVLAFAGASG